ncbi:hypothetical protein PC119_g23327 [Phytophthora cactorum]|nr:hypothetical protein PC119_g23327 [Phytophthora cactorum]KAG3148355.1 hypothetical protein PC128_g23621 [Phytophthora cactorum]
MPTTKAMEYSPTSSFNIAATFSNESEESNHELLTN